MERHRTKGEKQSTKSCEKSIERPVQADHGQSAADGGYRTAQAQPGNQKERQGDTQSLAPAHIQVVGHGTGAQYEPRPRDTPIENVGLQHAHKRPLFQMLHLDRRIEKNAAAVSLQARS